MPLEPQSIDFIGGWRRRFGITMGTALCCSTLLLGSFLKPKGDSQRHNRVRESAKGDSLFLKYENKTVPFFWVKRLYWPLSALREVQQQIMLRCWEAKNDTGCDGRCSRNFRVLARSIAAQYRKCRAALWSVLRQCRPSPVESAP